MINHRFKRSRHKNKNMLAITGNDYQIIENGSLVQTVQAICQNGSLLLYMS